MKKILVSFFALLAITAIAATALRAPTPSLLAPIAPLAPLAQPAPTAPPAPIADKSKQILVPVLVYHHINAPPANANTSVKSFFITPEWLEKHLEYLRQNGFQTIHFSDIAEYFKNGRPLPDRPIIISFDDGYKTVFENAFPILQKYEMTATVFAVANLIGKRAYMDWTQMQKLNDSGWEIGSHTLWHPYLTKSKRSREEIFESKKILEEKLGIPVTAFAYPYGDWNRRIENIVKEAGYATARSFTTGNGISNENLFHIPVVRIWANVGLERWKNQLFP